MKMPMKTWKRDLGYIREVGPDEERFNAAVQRVWNRIEELETALREVTGASDHHYFDRLQEIAREALK